MTCDEETERDRDEFIEGKIASHAATEGSYFVGLEIIDSNPPIQVAVIIGASASSVAGLGMIFGQPSTAVVTVEAAAVATLRLGQRIRLGWAQRETDDDSGIVRDVTVTTGSTHSSHG